MRSPRGLTPTLGQETNFELLLLCVQAVVNCGLLDRMTRSYRAESKKPVALRASYLGHLVGLANEIAAINSSDLQTLVKSTHSLSSPSSSRQGTDKHMCCTIRYW
jgi:hypothetical protein